MPTFEGRSEERHLSQSCPDKKKSSVERAKFLANFGFVLEHFQMCHKFIVHDFMFGLNHSCGNTN